MSLVGSSPGSPGWFPRFTYLHWGISQWFSGSGRFVKLRGGAGSGLLSKYCGFPPPNHGSSAFFWGACNVRTCKDRSSPGPEPLLGSKDI